MAELLVGLGQRSYPVIIADGCLQRLGEDLETRGISKRYGIIADDVVADLYGDLVICSLNAAGIDAELFIFPHGEASKSLKTIGMLAGKLVRFGFDRHLALIALGGGVTGDLTGFLASSYMRGIPFVQIPTSLVAQVDSSVGGKTGVDIPEGKNLVGAFYQPKLVYIDISVLGSLPKKEFLGGLAEVIKYAIIRDSDFFQFLRDRKDGILNLEPELIEKMVYICCNIKSDVVSEDEKEGGIRKILNYGHTIGHALEAASDYVLSHGFSVSIGMVAASRLALFNDILAREDYERIVDILQSYGLPIQVPAGLDRKRIKRYMLADKKAVAGKISYILPTQIGRTYITTDIAKWQVDKVLE